MSSHSRLDELAEHYATTDTSSELQEATAVVDDAPAPADRMTTFAVRLPMTELERTREIAEAEGLTTSALVRRWIDAGIAHDGPRDAGRVVAVEALLELIGRASKTSSGPEAASSR